MPRCVIYYIFIIIFYTKSNGVISRAFLGGGVEKEGIRVEEDLVLGARDDRGDVAGGLELSQFDEGGVLSYRLADHFRRLRLSLCLHDDRSFVYCRACIMQSEKESKMRGERERGERGRERERERGEFDDGWVLSYRIK